MIPLKDNIKSRKIPFVNYIFIILNSAVFIIEIIKSKNGIIDTFILKYAFVSSEFISMKIESFYKIFTSMFLHGDWLHFIGNMLYLYIFGDNVEDKMGHIKYLIFYLLSGVAAAITQVIFEPVNDIPMMGASGAIAGILGAYFLLFPGAKILTLVPFGIFTRIIEIPAFFYLGIWFIIQMISGTISLSLSTQESAGGIAFWAHTGGFLTGFFWVIFFTKRKKYLFFKI